jgi:hypothetical protein
LKESKCPGETVVDQCGGGDGGGAGGRVCGQPDHRAGYFEQQLQAQSGDGAVSLALSMSQQSKDVATMELLVAALFDGGHYRLIRFTDAAGRVLVERTQPDVAEVPGWLRGCCR